MIRRGSGGGGGAENAKIEKRQTGRVKAVTVCERVGSGADGVLPSEAGEAGEAFVGANEDGPVLESEGCEPGVVEVVAGERQVGDEFLQDAAVRFSGREPDRARIGLKLIRPETHDLTDVQRKDFRMRGDAQEGGFGQFGEADFVPGLNAIQQPLAARLVIFAKSRKAAEWGEISQAGVEAVSGATAINPAGRIRGRRACARCDPVRHAPPPARVSSRRRRDWGA